LSEDDRAYAEILELEENAIEDFDAIKTLYRKRIAQYHPDKVLAMGPEIREVAEQKAKEINEAYEYFRTKFKKDHTKQPPT
jgi:DnaJ like chaperone protein